VIVDEFKWVRWGVRAALALGVATSVTANVLHALPNPISQAIAAWPPLALLLTVELISRIPVDRRVLATVRLVATAIIAGIAAWVSYWHMDGVAARYGEVGAAPYLIPVSVDGVVVVASVCLVELAGRARIADISPDTKADIVRPARFPQTTRKPDTAKAIARIRAKHPDLPASEIAVRLGVTDRTVRRHLSAANS
jgi:DNA-binding transcriptional ArsR family regulator